MFSKWIFQAYLMVAAIATSNSVFLIIQLNLWVVITERIDPFYPKKYFQNVLFIVNSIEIYEKKFTMILDKFRRKNY